jgi:hypothetical protein
MNKRLNIEVPLFAVVSPFRLHFDRLGIGAAPDGPQQRGIHSDEPSSN